MNKYLPLLIAFVVMAVSAFERDALKPFPVLRPVPAYLQDVNRKFQSAPSLAVAPGGRLWCAWHTGGDTENQDNCMLVASSGDGGKTWSQPLFAVDAEGPLRVLDPGLWTAPDGRVWLFYSQLYGMWDGRCGVWAMHPADAESEQTAWSPARRLCDGYLKNKPLVTSDGAWLFPVEFMNSAPQAGPTWGCGELKGPESHPSPQMMGGNAFISRDRGATVSFLGQSAIPVKDRNCTENMIVERKDGTLWMLSRTSYGIGEAFSRDGGKTWTETRPSQIKNPDSRFFIGRLASGALLLVKNGPVDARTDRRQMMAYVSDDDGTTWTGGLTLDGRRNVSYPDAAQGRDGRIHVVHDRARTPAREILHHVFTEADVRAGRIVTTGSRLGDIVNRAGPKPPPSTTWTMVLEGDGARGAQGLPTRITTPAAAGAVTVEAWVKPAPGAEKGENAFWGQFAEGAPGRSNAQVYRGRAGFFNGGGNGWTVGRTILAPGRWHHVACVCDWRDGKETRIYVNGELDGVSEKPPVAVTEDACCSIGSMSGMGSSCVREVFKGRIAELRVWGRARTAAEIHRDFRRRLTGNETGQLAVFPFDGYEAGAARAVGSDARAPLNGHFKAVMDADCPLAEAKKDE